MATSLTDPKSVPWWKEPTKDQWYAYIAAWLGWTLDAFDFTIFLLIMVPIAQEFDVPLTAVTAVFTITLWLRLVGRHGGRLDGGPDGAQGAADDLHPVVLDLQLHRRLLAHLRLPVLLPRAARHRHGRGMAGRRGARHGILADALARLHERHPAGLLGSGLRAVGAGLRLPVRLIGWRGLLWIGILPAFVVVWVRFYVKEPEVWVENKRLQRENKAEVQRAAVLHLQARRAVQHADGLLVDGRGLLRLLLDLGAVLDLPAEGTALDAADGGHAAVLGQHRGLCRQRPVGPRGGQMGTAAGDHHAVHLSPSSSRRSTCGPRIRSGSSAGFILQGIFGGSIYGQNPSYLSERFPTEVRATASGFVYHQGAIWGGLVAPVLTYFAVQMNMGFAMPMMISTTLFLVIVIIAVLLGPETKGKHLVADLEIIRGAEYP